MGQVVDNGVENSGERIARKEWMWALNDIAEWAILYQHLNICQDFIPGKRSIPFNYC